MIFLPPLILTLPIAYKLTIIFLPRSTLKSTPKFPLTLLSKTTDPPIFQATQRAMEGTVPSF